MVDHALVFGPPDNVEGAWVRVNPLCFQVVGSLPSTAELDFEVPTAKVFREEANSRIAHVEATEFTEVYGGHLVLRPGVYKVASFDDDAAVFVKLRNCF